MNVTQSPILYLDFTVTSRGDSYRVELFLTENYLIEYLSSHAYIDPSTERKLYSNKYRIHNFKTNKYFGTDSQGNLKVNVPMKESPLFWTMDMGEIPFNFERNYITKNRLEKVRMTLDVFQSIFEQKEVIDMIEPYDFIINDFMYKVLERYKAIEKDVKGINCIVEKYIVYSRGTRIIKTYKLNNHTRILTDHVMEVFCPTWMKKFIKTSQ